MTVDDINALVTAEAAKIGLTTLVVGRMTDDAPLMYQFVDADGKGASFMWKRGITKWPASDVKERARIAVRSLPSRLKARSDA